MRKIAFPRESEYVSRLLPDLLLLLARVAARQTRRQAVLCRAWKGYVSERSEAAWSDSGRGKVLTLRVFGLRA